MNNFEFHTPTAVIFGKDTESRVGEEIKARGYKKVLVHFGGSSAKKSGLLDRVVASLDASGINHIELGGVVPNPKLSLARQGVELCRKEGVDFILAVGGGSVIDSAKGIAYGIANDFDIWDLFTGANKPVACAPVGSVLTIAAAGSEMSNSTVLTQDEDDDKRGYNNDICRPVFAILNPELTYTLPEFQTMCGVADILMHTLERYFTNDTGEVVDRMAEGLLVAVMNAGRRLLKNPRDYEARADVMWAGSLSHNGLTGVGRGQDWATHQLGHSLSGIYDVAHGAALSAVWPSWARFVYKHDPVRFAQLGSRVLGCPMNFFDPKETAVMAIDALEQYFRDVKMPVRMSELGVGTVDDAAIQRMVKLCSRDGTRNIGGFVVLDESDMKKIYEMAR